MKAQAAPEGVCLWRHPRPVGAAGRCIGRTDLPVDRRRAKRLAHRIRRQARHAGWPPVVWTSPLQRGAAVGRWLRRWGWVHRIDAHLAELDFGCWDGTPWSAIARADIDAWVADFVEAQPGGGESLRALLQRVGEWLDDTATQRGPRLVVGHAGWINAAVHLTHAGPDVMPTAAEWPAPPAYGALTRLSHRPPA